MKIFQFDHITYVAERKEKESILKGIEVNNELEWCEYDREILPGKKFFLKNFQPSHDLLFYGHREIPIEYIFYNQCNTPSVLVNIGTNTISCETVSLEAARKCAGYLGAKILKDGKSHIICDIKGVLDRKPVLLEFVVNNEFKDTLYLDNQGYGCVALVVNSIKTEKSEEREISASDEMLVHGRKLEISFAKFTGVGMLFELIKVKK